MDRKRIYKLQSQLDDAISRKAQHEKQIPTIKQELAQFFKDQCEGPEQSQEILLFRKRRGFEERLNKERAGIETTSVEIEVLQKALLEEGKKAIDEILAALSKDYSDSIAQCEQKNKQIGNLKWQVQQAEKVFIKLDLEKDNKHGAVRNFQKSWNAEKLVQLIPDPTNEQFTRGAGFIIPHLGNYVREQWEKAQQQRAKAEEEKRAQAEKERQASIMKRKAITDHALRICKGQEPLPIELQPLYTNNSIELNVLCDFLQRQAEKAKGVK